MREKLSPKMIKGKRISNEFVSNPTKIRFLVAPKNLEKKTNPKLIKGSYVVMP